MTEQEISVRKQINEMGYRLKYTNGKYFIKGYPNGQSFKTLDEIQEWICQEKREIQDREKYYQKMVDAINENTIFPTYTEELKNVFFKSINEHGIDNNSKMILNKIFDKNSELYDDVLTYGIENILSNINYNKNYSGQDLGSMVFSDMEGFYFSEIKRLNPNIDEEIIHDLPDYDFVSFYYEILEHIQIEELKEYIMALADHD